MQPESSVTDIGWAYPAVAQFPTPDRQRELSRGVGAIQTTEDARRFVDGFTDGYETMWVTQSWVDQEGDPEHNLRSEDRAKLRDFYWYGAWEPGPVQKAYRNILRRLSALFSPAVTPLA